MKILFATDGSVTADIALEAILEREWPAGTSWSVIAVVEKLNQMLDIALMGLGELAVRAEADLEADLHKLLTECQEKLKQKFGTDKVDVELLSGNPTKEIVEAAKRKGSDMLVVGSHSHNVDHHWSGSVTQAVVLAAPCTVLVLNTVEGYSAEKKERQKEAVLEDRYLVAVSDDKNAKMVTDHILELTWPENSKFQIISVVNKPPKANQSRFFNSANLKEFHDKAFTGQKQTAEKLVKSVATKLESKFPAKNVTFHVLEGSPRSIILQVAQDWPADMIIMGSHDKDHSFLEHYFGSTAQAVVWNADCSVDLVKSTKVPAIK